MIVHSFTYKESRCERLKAEFERMGAGAKKRHRIVFRAFLAVTVPVVYITYRLFCRFWGAVPAAGIRGEKRRTGR